MHDPLTYHYSADYLQRRGDSAMATWRGPGPPKDGASWLGAQRATRRTVPCSCLTAPTPA